MKPAKKTALRKVVRHLGSCALPAIAAATLAAPAHAEDAPVAAPELTSNIGVVSEYVFRGIRQTWGNPAIQGGVDYAHASGFYVGTWLSNTSGNLYANANIEVDVYGGYRGAVGDFAYDVGVLQFIFPQANYDKITPAGSYAKKSYDSTEFYLSGTWQWLNVKYSRAMTDVGYFGFNSNNAGPGAFPNKPGAGVTGKDTTGSWYIEANVNYEFLPTWTATLHAGRQTIANSKGLDYSDYKVGISKAMPGSWTLGLAYTTTAGADYWKNYPSVAGNGTTKDMNAGTWIASVNRVF